MSLCTNGTYSFISIEDRQRLREGSYHEDDWRSVWKPEERVKTRSLIRSWIVGNDLDKETRVRDSEKRRT